MWKSRPERPKRCKLPGFFSMVSAPVGSIWECPRCGDLWEKKLDSVYLGDTRMVPVNPRTHKGCGSWSCDCGPHEEQLWNFDCPGDTIETPYLCMIHRRHLPCRSCE